MKYIITGASRGIGFDAALALASEHQVLALSRSEQKLKTLAEKSQEKWQKNSLIPLVFDLTAPNWTALDRAVEQMGGVDGIINNAGLLINKPFTQLEHVDWQQLYAVNLFGPVYLTRHLFPWLEKSTNGHVLNISSMGGFQGSAKFPGLSAYSSSKAALGSLTECLAEEWKDFGIRVNALALGAVQTEMLETAFPGFQAPLTSAEMGDFIAWFVQNGHRFFNGKILPVSVSTP